MNGPERRAAARLAEMMRGEPAALAPDTLVNWRPEGKYNKVIRRGALLVGGSDPIQAVPEFVELKMPRRLGLDDGEAKVGIGQQPFLEQDMAFADMMLNAGEGRTPEMGVGTWGDVNTELLFGTEGVRILADLQTNHIVRQSVRAANAANLTSVVRMELTAPSFGRFASLSAAAPAVVSVCDVARPMKRVVTTRSVGHRLIGDGPFNTITEYANQGDVLGATGPFRSSDGIQGQALRKLFGQLIGNARGMSGALIAARWMYWMMSHTRAGRAALILPRNLPGIVRATQSAWTTRPERGEGMITRWFPGQAVSAGFAPVVRAIHVSVSTYAQLWASDQPCTLPGLGALSWASALGRGAIAVVPYSTVSATDGLTMAAAAMSYLPTPVVSMVHADDAASCVFESLAAPMGCKLLSCAEDLSLPGEGLYGDTAGAPRVSFMFVAANVVTYAAGQYSVQFGGTAVPMEAEFSAPVPMSAGYDVTGDFLALATNPNADEAWTQAGGVLRPLISSDSMRAAYAVMASCADVAQAFTTNIDNYTLAPDTSLVVGGLVDVAARMGGGLSAVVTGANQGAWNFAAMGSAAKMNRVYSGASLAHLNAYGADHLQWVVPPAGGPVAAEPTVRPEVDSAVGANLEWDLNEGDRIKAGVMMSDWALSDIVAPARVCLYGGMMRYAGATMCDMPLRVGPLLATLHLVAWRATLEADLALEGMGQSRARLALGRIWAPAADGVGLALPTMGSQQAIARDMQAAVYADMMAALLGTTPCAALAGVNQVAPALSNSGFFGAGMTCPWSYAGLQGTCVDQLAGLHAGPAMAVGMSALPDGSFERAGKPRAADLVRLTHAELSDKEFLGRLAAITVPNTAGAVATVVNLSDAQFMLHAILWCRNLIEQRYVAAPGYAPVGLRTAAANFEYDGGLGYTVHPRGYFPFTVRALQLAGEQERRCARVLCQLQLPGNGVPASERMARAGWLCEADLVFETAWEIARSDRWALATADLSVRVQAAGASANPNIGFVWTPMDTMTASSYLPLVQRDGQTASRSRVPVSSGRFAGGL